MDQKLTTEELERAARATPLPLDATWSTGDQDFDARIHATLMQLATEREARERALAALSAIWETAASGGSVADDTDWSAVHRAIAAAKVTP